MSGIPKYLLKGHTVLEPSYVFSLPFSLSRCQVQLHTFARVPWHAAFRSHLAERIHPTTFANQRQQASTLLQPHALAGPPQYIPQGKTSNFTGNASSQATLPHLLSLPASQTPAEGCQQEVRASTCYRQRIPNAGERCLPQGKPSFQLCAGPQPPEGFGRMQDNSTTWPGGGWR